MQHLEDCDLLWCTRRLPSPVVTLLKRHPNSLAVAGGFIRSVIANEKVADIDIFCNSKDHATTAAATLQMLAGHNRTLRLIETENAITVIGLSLDVQFIHRWTYAHPKDVIPSFDFTIAQAAFWWQESPDGWVSMCHDRFYSDLAGKRLVYTSPQRNEDAGGSMLRVLKFYQRGYRIPLDSLGAVVARLMSGVNMERVSSESDMARVVTGLLREVDPATDPDHIAHLPSAESSDPHP